MPKFIQIINYGYGEEHDVIEAKNQKDADEYAYEAWKEGAESQAMYTSVPLTEETAEEYGFEDHLKAT